MRIHTRPRILHFTRCALVVIVGLLADGQSSAAEGGPAIADVVRAIDSIPTQGTLLSFTRADFALPPGGHLQGIQMHADSAGRRHLAFLSHDSQKVAYLLVVEFPGDLAASGRVIHVHEFPSDGRVPPLRHAGGIQLAGDVLAVGLEDNQQKTRSEVQFWNVSDPTKPAQLPHLTIRRSGAAKDQTAGAVGLIQREKDHLLAVANWDSRAIDFYTASGKPLADTGCRFGLRRRWTVEAADTSDWQPDRDIAAYQAINLVGDATGATYLVGFATTPAGQDVADLFTVDLAESPGTVLRKVARKPMKLQAGNRFLYAAGLWIDDGRAAILSSQRNLADVTRLNLAR